MGAIEVKENIENARFRERYRELDDEMKQIVKTQIFQLSNTKTENNTLIYALEDYDLEKIIRFYMKKSGYKSIAKVAEKANLDERTIVKYIKGKSDNINNYAFKCVCDVLNIPRNDFNIPYIRTEDLTDQVGKNMPKRYYPLKQDKIRENIGKVIDQKSEEQLFEKLDSDHKRVILILMNDLLRYKRKMQDYETIVNNHFDEYEHVIKERYKDCDY